MQDGQQNQTLFGRAKAGMSAAWSTVATGFGKASTAVSTAFNEKFKTKKDGAEFVLGKGWAENFAGDEKRETNILGGIRKIGLFALTIVAAVIAAPFVGPAIAAIGCLAGMALLRSSDNFTKTQTERDEIEKKELEKKSPQQIEARQEELEKRKSIAKYVGIAAAILLALVLFAPAAPIVGVLIGLVGPTTLGLGAFGAAATSFFVSRDADKKLEKIETFVSEKEQAAAKEPTAARAKERRDEVEKVRGGSPSEIELSTVRSAAAGLTTPVDDASLTASSRAPTPRHTHSDL